MIYLLPGMGANREMYKDWEQSDRYTFLDWPRFGNEASLSEVAKRIIEENDIRSSDLVGGSSLGGIIAIEIDKLLNNPKVILLGSAIGSSEINSLLLKLSSLSDYAPVKLIQLLTGKYDNSLLNMFSESDPKFIKAMCKLSASWEGYLSLPDKLIRIHGTQDLVIKCSQVGSEKLSAGHLIAMSHPKQCQELIKKQLG